MAAIVKGLLGKSTKTPSELVKSLQKYIGELVANQEKKDEKVQKKVTTVVQQG